VSKKVSEFERYERMKKIEKEAEVEKRKSEGAEKKKAGRPKQVVGLGTKGDYRGLTDYDDYDDE
jgi:hypothetical protein